MFKSKKTVSSLNFFIIKAKLVFTKLKQVFIKALILYHFNFKCYIRIEINALGLINRVLSQLILDHLGQWHLVVFFLKDDSGRD